MGPCGGIAVGRKAYALPVHWGSQRSEDDRHGTRCGGSATDVPPSAAMASRSSRSGLANQAARLRAWRVVGVTIWPARTGAQPRARRSVRQAGSSLTRSVNDIRARSPGHGKGRFVLHFKLFGMAKAPDGSREALKMFGTPNTLRHGYRKPYHLASHELLTASSGLDSFFHHARRRAPAIDSAQASLRCDVHGDIPTAACISRIDAMQVLLRVGSVHARFGAEAMSDAGEFLEHPDLKRLTGRQQKSRQIEWLRAEGIPFRVSATGHPVVLWAAIKEKHVATSESWRPRALEA